MTAKAVRLRLGGQKPERARENSMRIRSLALIGAVAGTVLVSGVAVADIPDAGVFHACVDNRRDADSERVLRLIDTSKGGSCRKDEVALSWNAVGPAGPAGPAGPQGPQGPAGPAGGGSTVLMNRNFEDVPTNSAPGVSVAHLDLGPGTWVLQAKLRYRNNGQTRQTASCVFQGTGIGDLDGSQQNVDAGGEQNGQADGSLMDIVIKRPGDPTDVHLQCFGPSDGSIHIINAQLLATLPSSLTLK
jgi:hypothetical protein